MELTTEGLLPGFWQLKFINEIERMSADAIHLPMGMKDLHGMRDDINLIILSYVKPGNRIFIPQISVKWGYC